MFSIFFLFWAVILNHSSAQFDPTQHSNWHLLQSAYCEGSINSRIIGHTEAVMHEFPWMVWLIAKSRMRGSETFLQCGGSILNKRTVLTAAHCVNSFEKDKNKTLWLDEFGMPYKIEVIKVGLGDHNVFTDPDCAGCAPVQVIDVKEMIFHIGWNNITLVNDIALIRLAKDIEFNSHVSAICLPRGYLMEDTHTYSKYVAIAAGWGLTHPRAKIHSPTLNKVFLHTRDNPACVWRWQICAENPGKGVCFGDSGGPLMIVDRELTHGEPRVYVIGVTSFVTHDDCVVEHYPQVFARVASYMPWILDNLVQDTIDYIRV